MIKVYINNEEVLCDKNIVIKKEMLNTSSTILNNVYPKSWETTHDYTTNYYYPLDYSNCKITDVRETPAEEGQTIEGTNFNIDVDLSKEYSFDDFKGNTTQEGTPTPDAPIEVKTVKGIQKIVVYGKNLFDYDNTTLSSVYGKIATKSDNGYLGGWAYIINLQSPIKAGTYYLSFKVNNADNSPTSYIDFRDINGSAVNAVNVHSAYSRVITFAKDVYSLKVDNGQNTSTTLIKDIMIEKGSTATEYEAYQGQSYQINYLDLFDKNGDIIENHRLSTTGTNYSEAGYFISPFIKIEPNTQYTINYTPNAYTRICYYTSNTENTYISRNDNQATFTTPSNAEYLRFCNLLSNINDIQLLGSNTIELCKIGDYQDRIYKDSGKWYIEKKIGKAVFNGSEDWNNTYGTNLFDIQGYFNDKPFIIGYGLSNYYKYNSIQSGINGRTVNGEFVLQKSEKNYNIFFKNTDYSSPADFKTWLSTHNTTVYYVLATPTTTEITDSTLINQLESIELIEGINNISSNGNLPIIMNLHYNYVTHRIDTTLLFSGIVKNTGNISLNPREPHYSSIEVLGYETFLSEGETLDFVIYEKTIEEAIDLVINTISDYGIIKGNINIKNPNDIIGAYSTKDKTAYDVFNYIADITQSRWTTRIIDENTIAIDFYDPDLMVNGTNLDFTQEFFANNNIIDMQYNYGTRDYRNKQVMNSNAVYSNIETNETIIADGYQTQFNTTDKIGQITKMTLNGNEVIVRTKDEYELGYTCDFYYTPGNNYFESVDLVSTGGILVIDYYAIIQGREILLNNTEINRVNSMTGRKGVISRYEDRNDATTTTELSQIGQSYLRYKGSPEIILTIESLNDIWNIGEKVEFNNAPLNELATEYMVKKKTIHYIPTVDNIFYEFELTSNFNSENAINYFDNQRSKNKGNIGQGETISRNIDISNTANVIFYDVDIQEVSVEDDNILNSTLNSPLVQ